MKESFRNDPPEYPGNYTQLIVDGPQIRETLLREINRAQHFIHFQVMLFYSDEAGMEIASALAKRAREGITVRVMSDSPMSRIVRFIEKTRSSAGSSFEELQEIFAASGVKYLSSDDESYYIWHWKEKRKKLQNKGVPEEFLKMQDKVQDGIFFNINVFDHRKLKVYDGETSIVMGANIGNKYLYRVDESENPNPNPHNWHDGGILIKGAFSTELNKHFASKWMVRDGDLFDYTEHYRKKAQYGEDRMSVFEFFPGMDSNQIRDLYLHKMRTCQGRFIIQNPYVNDEEVWNTLAALPDEQAKKIILINPYTSDGNDYPQNRSAIQCNMWKPFQKGTSLYDFNRRMTHWKIALDEAADEVFVGSYNLNHRSAYHDFELNVLVKSAPLSKQVLAMLQKDIAQSVKITDQDEFFENPNLHPSCLLLKATEYFE